MTTTTIWRLPTVIAHTGLSRSSIYDKMQKGVFPPSIKLGPRAIGWPSNQIERWIQERINESITGDK